MKEDVVAYVWRPGLAASGLSINYACNPLPLSLKIHRKTKSELKIEKMGWRGVLGFPYGIVQAPLGPDISGPELVAAVANAGAIGFLRAPDWVRYSSPFPLSL